MINLRSDFILKSLRGETSLDDSKKSIFCIA